MKIKNIFVSLLIITSMLMSNVYAVDNVANIYVSVNGSDSGDGSYNSPLQTLQAANAKVAEIKGSYSGVNVNIMAGTYNVSDLTFGADNSGSADAKIVWKAYNNDKVVLTAGQKIDNSRITAVDTDATQKIPVRALNNVKQVKLTDAEISAIGAVRYTGQKQSNHDAPAYLTQDGKMYEIAGYPNKVRMPILKSNIKITEANQYEYTITDSRISRWSDAKDAYLTGNPNYEWWDESLVITEITDSKITTTDTGDYGLRPDSGAKLRIVNLVEEIDYPGEFYIDREAGYLYFYPLNSISGSTFSLVTSQKSILNIDGAQHISFENLIFEETCSTGILIKNSDNITVKNCELKNIGKNAIDIKDSKNTTIEGTHIYNIGKTAISLNGGGDFATLTPSNNVIKNCHIEKYGKFLYRNANAFNANGIGDTISHNRIHAAAHSAIMFSGNNNIIEYNDIYDVLNEADDAGVIYGGRSWVDGGTQIKYNYIHDNPYTNASSSSRSGVYLDDGFAGTTIYGNVFANMNAGVKLHGSQHNDVQNNVFINLKSSLRLGNLNGDTDSQITADNNKINTLLAKGLDHFKLNYSSELKEVRGAPTFYSRYFAKFDPSDKTTAAYQLWNTTFPYLENYVSSTGKHLTPKGNVIKNNASFPGGHTWPDKSPMDYQEGSIEDGDLNELGFNPIWQDVITDVRNVDYALIKEDLDGFEALDITKAGIEGETSLTLNNFGVVYPQNQAYVEPGSPVLIWGEDSGADKYHLTVSKNADLSNPIKDLDVEDSFYKLDNLTAGKYYWTVDAVTSHHLYANKTKRVNEGISEFTVSQDAGVITLSNIVYRNGDGNRINAIENAAVNVVEFDLCNYYSKEITATATLESFNGAGVSVGIAEVSKSVKANDTIKAGVGITTSTDSDAYMILTIDSGEDCVLQYRIDNAAMAGQYVGDKLAITSVTVSSGAIVKGGNNAIESVVKSLADGEQRVRCIMATYDSNDMLVASDAAQLITLKKGDEHTFNTEALVSSDANAYVKLFFWNDKMQPLVTDYDVQ